MPALTPPLYSVVVPIYNGAATLRLLQKQLVAFFTQNQLPYEVIYVYDCGTDNSWEILLNIKKQYPDVVTIIKPLHNNGQHGATLYGISRAKGSFILTLDEDLQHPPAEIAKLIHTQQSGNYDLVYGAYQQRKHHNLRNLLAAGFAFALALTIPNLPKQFTSFRLFTRQLAQKISALPKPPYLFIDGLFAQQNPHIAICPIEHQPPNAHRGSSYNFISLINHATGILATYTPLMAWLAVLLFLCWTLTLYSFFFPDKTNWHKYLLSVLYAITTIGTLKWVLLQYLKSKWKNKKPYLPIETH